jgi:hypothetical protein
MRQATPNLQESTVTETNERHLRTRYMGAPALTITTSLVKLSISHLFHPLIPATMLPAPASYYQQLVRNRRWYPLQGRGFLMNLRRPCATTPADKGFSKIYLNQF